MKYAERVDLQRVISKLETNDFDSNDIRLILIMLREYSDHKSLFREISHFVAHKNRDQGEFYSRIEGIHCLSQLQLLCKHGFIIDYSKPPLPEVSKAIFFKASFASDQILKKHGFDKQSLLQEVNKYFPIKVKDNFEPNPSYLFYEMIMEILKEPIDLVPLYNGKDLIESLTDEIKRHGFNLDIQKVSLSRLLFNLLPILHGTQLQAQLLKKIVGTINFGILDINNKKNITLMGLVRASHTRPRFPQLDMPHITIEENFEFSFSIVQTELQANDWCSQNYINTFNQNCFLLNELETFINDEGKLDINIAPEVAFR